MFVLHHRLKSLERPHSSPSRNLVARQTDAICRDAFRLSQFPVRVVSTRLRPHYALCFEATRTSVLTVGHGFARVSISVQLVGLRSRVRKLESCWGRLKARRSACRQAPGRHFFILVGTPPPSLGVLSARVVAITPTGSSAMASGGAGGDYL